MASNVIKVSVIADAKQFEKGFKDAQTQATKMGAAIGTFAANVAFSLGQKAIGAVKDFVGDSVRAYSDLNESINAVQVIYGKHADAVLALGKKSADSLGVSNSAFNSWAVSMGAFAKQIAGDGGDASAVVDTMSKRIADFASVMNLDFEEASQKFQAGMAGQSEPLRAFGIDVSEARIKTQALNDGIWDGKGVMDEAQKVQARYNTIMEQTADTAGDFSNTQDDLANATRRAEAAAEDAKAKLGESLAPTMLELTQLGADFTTIVDGLAGAMGGMTGESDTGLISLLKWVPTIGDTIRQVEKWAAWMREGQEKQDALDSATRRVTHGQYELNTELKGGRPVLQQHTGAVDDLETAEGDLEDATEDANEEIRTQNELLNDALDRINGLIDPAFKYINAQNDLAEAQAAYNAAVEEFGENSPEAIAAAEDIASANMGIQEAVVAIGEEGVPAAMEALKSMGVPESVIKKFGEDKRRIEELFRNMVLRIGVQAPSLFPTSPQGGGVGWQSSSKTYYNRGGVTNGESVIGDGGREAILPLESAHGIKAISQAMEKAGGGNAGPNYHITVNALDPRAAAKAVVEALQQYERSNGAIPIRTRGA